MAVPYTVMLPGGGSVTVNANSPEAARQNAGVDGSATVVAGGHQTTSNSSGQTVVNPDAHVGAGEVGRAPNAGGGTSAISYGTGSTTSGGYTWGPGSSTAADGRTLSGESAATQQQFRAVWGANAEQEWAKEHTAAIGAAPSGSSGGTSGSSGGSSGSSGGSAGSSGGSGAPGSDLDAQFQKMLAALASGNKAAFDESVRQFNETFGEQKRQYDLGRTDQLDQFAKNFGLNAGQLTGMYNGSPTLAAQNQAAQLSGMYNGMPTEQAREFNVNDSQRSTDRYANLGQSLLSTATQLRGPRDYLQYQQLTRGGQDLLSQLQGTQPIPAFGAPGGQLQSANLGNALSDLGFDPASIDPRLAALVQGQSQGGGYSPTGGGGVYPVGMGDVPASAGLQVDPSYPVSGPSPTYGGGGSDGYPVGGPVPTAAGLTPDSSKGSLSGGYPAPSYPVGGPVPMMGGAGGSPQTAQQQLLTRFGLQAGQQLLPNQINPARWDAMGSIGRDLTKNLAETRYGYDATDFENQINATRPQGQAARMTSTRYAAPRGIF